MCQKSAKGFIMLLFLAAAAYLIAVNKAVVRYINFISAIAQTMPDNKALCISFFRRVLRSQPAESPAGNV